MQAGEQPLDAKAPPCRPCPRLVGRAVPTAPQRTRKVLPPLYEPLLGCREGVKLQRRRAGGVPERTKEGEARVSVGQGQEGWQQAKLCR